MLDGELVVVRNGGRQTSMRMVRATHRRPGAVPRRSAT